MFEQTPQLYGMMTWNVRAGGFDAYDPQLELPSRQAAIVDVINRLHRPPAGARPATSAALTDTYRWDELYLRQDEAGLARHLGFNSAYFASLDDKALTAEHGAGIGVTFATDEPVADVSVLDMGTRNGLGVVLDIGSYGLQVATVYMDFRSEERRLRQAGALLAELKPDIPTLLVGDFNSLRADTVGMALRHKLGNNLIRMAGIGLPLAAAACRAVGRQHPVACEAEKLLASVANMNRRQLVPMLVEQGFIDGDPAGQPTLPARLPLLGLDYAFSRGGATVSNLRRPGWRQTGGASDHLPLVFDVAA